jgi:hypothetical protein
VTQVLIVAVQNGVERTQLGTATAATNFFRALGGAVGAAVLGAVFTARVGASASSIHALDAAARGTIADAVQVVLLAAAPLALIALAILTRLPEVPLRGRAR